MIIKKNDYINEDTIIGVLTEQESDELRTISSIPVLESNGSYIISYDHIRDISETYDIEDIDVINTINESNGIEESIVSIDESDIILDSDIVNRVPNYVISPLSYNSDENLLIEGFFNAFEESGDYDFLDILEENFEDIIINESGRRKRGRGPQTPGFMQSVGKGETRVNPVNNYAYLRPNKDKVTKKNQAQLENEKEANYAAHNRFDAASADEYNDDYWDYEGTTKPQSSTKSSSEPKEPPRVEKVNDNTVSVEQPSSKKETSSSKNTSTDIKPENQNTQSTQQSAPSGNNEQDKPNRVHKAENPTSTKSTNTSSDKSDKKEKEGEKSFYSKNKKTIGGVGAGLALGGLALANRKRIANGISALRNKLNKYKMQRKYDKSGAVGKAIIRIQQMIERLTARLHASK